MAFTQILQLATVDGTALTNTTTATSLLPPQAKVPWAGGLLKYVGQEIQVRASGRISTVVTTPGTLTLDLRFGSIVIANGGAMTLSTTAKTNVTWTLQWDLTLRTIGGGTAATFFQTGAFASEVAGATTVAGEAKTIMLPQSAPAVGSGFDETASQTLDLFATWSVANASNSITLHQYKVLAGLPL